MTNDARDTLLLAHLASKFTGGTEILATEALGYVLSRSAGARDALQGMLRVHGVDVGTIARVQTECIIEVEEKNARPDLVGLGTADAKRTIVECKFWAELTEQQPNAYLKELLKNTEPSVLLFVAPESRLETLWPEILRLGSVGGFSLDEAGETTGTGWRSAVVNNGDHRLMATSWRTLLKEMSGKTGDPTIENDVRQLQSLCDQQDQSAFLPLHQGELGRDFSRRVMDLRNVHRDVISRLKKESVEDFKGLGPSNWGLNYGHYIWLGRSAPGDTFRAWIGVCFEAVQHRETPFWVLFEGKHNQLGRVREKLNAAPKGAIDVIHDAHNIWVPIYLRTGVEYDAVLDAVVKNIRTIYDLCGAA